MLLIASALAFPSRPAHATPPASLARSVDQPVDVPLRTAPALGDQHASAVAFGAGIYVTVWLDRGLSAQETMMAARSDAQGKLLDDPPIAVASANGVDFPTVAFDGKRFLLTWVYNNQNNAQDIDAAYLDPANGMVSASFHLVARPEIQSYQATAGGLDGNGNAFALVAWLDQLGSPKKIHAALLDGTGAFAKNGNGKVLSDVTISTNGLLPSKAPVDAQPPAVAWNGSTFLIAWTEENGKGAPVTAATFDTLGTVSAPFRVDNNGTRAFSIRNSPSAACKVATDCTGMGTQQCTGGNCYTVVNESRIETLSPTVASDGKQFLVAWSDYRVDPGSLYLFARLVTAGGTFPGPDFQVAQPQMPATDAMNAQATFQGGNYLLAWEGYSNATTGSVLFQGRLDPTGMPLDGDGIQVTPSSVNVALGKFRRSTFAGDGKRAMLAWDGSGFIEGGATGVDVFLFPVDPSKTPQMASSLLEDREANFQRAHAVATDGSVFLLVWEDDRNYVASGIDIVGLRVDASGKPLDVDAMGNAKPFVICDQPGDQILPSAAALPGGGAPFLVVWSDGRSVSPDGESGAMEIYGARVGEKDAPLDKGGFLITTRPQAARLAPTVAARTGGGWLVAWEDWRNNPELTLPYAEIWAATVSADGKPGAEQQVEASGNMVELISCAPVAAWNGNRFLVAWEQPCSQYPSMAVHGLPSHLVGQWFDASDQVEKGATVVLAQNAKSDEKALQLALAPNNVLIAAWRASSGGNDEIRVATLADHAMKSAPAMAVDGSGSGVREAPSVTYSAAAGASFVTWIDTAPAGDAKPGVVALRLDATLAPIDTSPFNLAAGVGGGTYRVPVPPDNTLAHASSGADVVVFPRATPPASTAALATGEVLSAWSFIEQLAGRNVPRMHYRAFGLAPRGVACTAADQCADGICTDRGVCCDTPCDGICRTCTTNGCVGVPATDRRCGVGDSGAIACGALSTECRHYSDLPANQCQAFGECAEPGNLAVCTTFTDAPDGTTCGGLACEGGVASCRAGSCECATPHAAPVLGDWALGGCEVSGARGRSPATLLVVLALFGAAFGRRRRRATSTR